ncbi:MAG: ABC-type cobalt transport system, permease component [Methanobacterium sp. PtaU1.Bin242]|jgi:energy-coupling factor transport system substrate-specific component|nr:ECF transporter S component [Candidatus Atribacteria bacterium]OPY25206.1 MAG: ABC-type cobalt transport system, permease component [Methanobacterium sp. PtaU1.Bin242]
MTEEISKRVNRSWTTRDIMVTAIISIALGVLYIPLSYAIGLLYTVPLLYPFVVGIYYFPIIMVAYLIRKPGVAIFSSMVIHLVTIPFTPWGITMLMSGFFIGLPIEAVFLAGRYKNFKLWYLVIVGAITGLVNATISYVMMGFANISPSLQIVYVIGYMISGAVLGGLLAKFIGDAVFKTGIISNVSDET